MIRPAVSTTARRGGALTLRVFVNAGPWLPIPPCGYGGVENMLAHLIKELRGQGHRVILGTVGQSEIEVDEQVATFPAGQHPLIDAPYSDAVWVAHTHMQRVLKAIRKIDGIDIVHDFLEIVGPSTLAELGPGDPPVLHTLQWNLSSPHRTFYRRFEGNRRVWFNGISEPQMAAARGNLRERALGVVHNGVNLDEFTYREDDDGYVITLARFTRDKGQDIAARICGRLGLPLYMAGTVGGIPSPERLSAELARPDSPFQHYRDVKYYQRSVRPYELRHPQISWIGSVGGDQKRDLVAGAVALLMPIRWQEPFGMAVIEALASGTPVVAMRRGAMPVLIEHGYNGFLAEDERELKECLQRVKDGEIKPENCRRSVARRFSAAVMAKRYVRLYQEIIEGPAIGNGGGRLRGPDELVELDEPAATG
jgi:glycosyltransferase involved in cell wall biosynthesis